MASKWLLVPILMFLMISCESKLYPPTDPPVISNIVLTSSSYTSATSKVYEGDTVFMTVDVADPEDDPETLSVSILSGSTEVLSEEFGESRIHDGEYWEGWLETNDLAVGSYTLNFTATDKEGNISDTISQSFEIEIDPGPTVMADLITTTLTVTVNPVWLADGEDSDLLDGIDEDAEPFRVLFEITNNSAVKIDLAYIKINVEDSLNAIIEEGIATVTALEAGEIRIDQQMRFNIPDDTNVDHVLYSDTESSVVIY